MVVYRDPVQAFEGPFFAWASCHASCWVVIMLQVFRCHENLHKYHFAFVLPEIGAGADPIKSQKDLIDLSGVQAKVLVNVRGHDAFALVVVNKFSSLP